MFAASPANVTLQACDWKAGMHSKMNASCCLSSLNFYASGVSCEWPAWTAWYKPLSSQHKRNSTMAILLLNNANHPADLSFSWTSVPGVRAAPKAVALGHLVTSSDLTCVLRAIQLDTISKGCTAFDINARHSIGRVDGKRFVAKQVGGHDSVFLTLSQCE